VTQHCQLTDRASIRARVGRFGYELLILTKVCEGTEKSRRKERRRLDEGGAARIHFEHGAMHPRSWSSSVTGSVNQPLCVADRQQWAVL
jgi:hypothetical protein